MVPALLVIPVNKSHFRDPPCDSFTIMETWHKGRHVAQLLCMLMCGSNCQTYKAKVLRQEIMGLISPVAGGLHEGKCQCIDSRVFLNHEYFLPIHSDRRNSRGLELIWLLSMFEG